MTEIAPPTKIRLYPIVGQNHRPPAALIIEHLPLDTPLILRREPTNPHDPNAIQVLISGQELGLKVNDKMDTVLSGRGFDVSTYINMDEFHLGFIPAAVAKFLVNESGFPLTDLPTTLRFDAAGKPQVWIKTIARTGT